MTIETSSAFTLQALVFECTIFFSQAALGLPSIAAVHRLLGFVMYHKLLVRPRVHLTGGVQQMEVQDYPWTM